MQSTSRRTLLSSLLVMASGLCLSAPAFAADEAASAPKAAAADAAGSTANANPRVSLTTSMGEIVLELNQEKAPKSVANFLQYVRSGQYKKTIFHRVINGFMIQGGGFELKDGKMHQKHTGAAIENEAKNGLKNEPYTLAMARTGDPHSATAQFFINVNDNSMLDYPGRDGWGYAVLGKVVKGMDVVDKIKQVATGNSGPFQNVPSEPVVIESATLVK
jgi:peptidyl-prolyl cis-trans isomerase A (cyclophilin A)